MSPFIGRTTLSRSRFNLVTQAFSAATSFASRSDCSIASRSALAVYRQKPRAFVSTIVMERR